MRKIRMPKPMRANREKNGMRITLAFFSFLRLFDERLGDFFFPSLRPRKIKPIPIAMNKPPKRVGMMLPQMLELLFRRTDSEGALGLM